MHWPLLFQSNIRSQTLINLLVHLESDGWTVHETHQGHSAIALVDGTEERLPVIQYLIASGANIHTRDQNDHSILDRACIHRAHATIQWLLEQDAMVTMDTIRLYVHSQMATICPTTLLQLVKSLSGPLDVDAFWEAWHPGNTHDGLHDCLYTLNLMPPSTMSPLQFCCPKMVQWCQGLDIPRRDDMGRTPLHTLVICIANDSDFERALPLLQYYQDCHTSVDATRLTPLHYAILHPAPMRLLQYLLDLEWDSQVLQLIEDRFGREITAHFIQRESALQVGQQLVEGPSTEHNEQSKRVFLNQLKHLWR